MCQKPLFLSFVYNSDIVHRAFHVSTSLAHLLGARSQQQAYQLHHSIPGFGFHQSALNKTVTWLTRLRVWCDSYLAATGGSCEYRSPMCFALFMYSLQCLVGGLKWWWMNQEKRTKVISFVFCHPTSCVVQCHLWVATIPTYVAARSGSRLTLGRWSPSRAPAGHFQPRLPALSGFQVIN